MIPLSYSVLTDGTTTLDLLDGSRYALKNFDPVLAALQESELASGGPYLPVTQPLTLDIFGDTELRCWENAHALIRLLDQGHRWNKDTPENAVRHVIQTGFYATKVEALVLGQVGGDPFGGMTPEFEFPAPGSRYVLRDVTLAYLRSGVWEATAETEVVSSLVANPGIMSVAFSSSNNTYSRVRLRGYKDGVTPGFLRTATSGVLILTSDAAKIQINTAGGFSKISGSATVTFPADSNAVGGTLIRTTAHTGVTKLQDAITFTALKRRVALFAAVRNNSASNTFYLRGEVVDGTQNPNTTPIVVVSPSTVFPQIVYLGMVTARYDLMPAAYCNIYINAASTNASDTLDINYVCLVCLDDQWTDRYLTIGPAVPSPSGAFLSNSGDILIEPGTSVARTPYPLMQVWIDMTPSPLYSALPYQGDPYIVAKGNGLAAVWLSTEGNGPWYINALGQSQLRIGARRARAYRLPPGAGEP